MGRCFVLTIILSRAILVLADDFLKQKGPRITESVFAGPKFRYLVLFCLYRDISSSSLNFLHDIILGHHSPLEFRFKTVYSLCWKGL